MAKLIISSKELLTKLNDIKSVVPSNPVIPILENFLFECSDGILSVTASDLQNAITTQISVDTEDKFNVAVPARMVLDTLRNLPEQPVTFKIDMTSHGIEVVSDNGRYTMAGEDAGDFPRPAQPKNTTSVMLESKSLKEALGYTIDFVSSDEMKPAMNGIFFSFKDDKLTLAATDSHRLSRVRIASVGNHTNQAPLVAGKGLDLLGKVLKGEHEINFEFNETNAFFTFGTIKIVSRLIDERFPDYENAIPTSNDKMLNIDRSQLYSSLKRISIYANKTSQQVRFKLENNNLLISAEDVDFSNEAKENLPCDYDSEPLEIGFNGKFLLEILSTLDNVDKITMEFSEPNRAALIYPMNDVVEVSEQDVLVLVMPVMLNNYY